MKYVGSKNRHAKYILPILERERSTVSTVLVDVFCGGCNLIDKARGPRIANDSHFYLIELMKAIQSGWVPPTEVSEEEYKYARLNQDKLEPYLIGFIGFGCSYVGKWFGGYARGAGRNWCLETRNNLLNQAEGLKGIEFYNKDYRDVDIPKRSVIYCDPPYQGTTAYKGTSKFDYSEFWAWVRNMSRVNRVFVSGYTAPPDFGSVWEREISSMLDNNRPKTDFKETEKLFVLRR